MNLLNMFNKFEEYIGPVSMINSTSLKGLHEMIEYEDINSDEYDNSDVE